MLCKDAFQPLGNSQVEAKFADTRTYIYKGKDVDQQVHLGFDLAGDGQRLRSSPSQRGVVVHAADLGIYGNCVVIDHGLGVQSLYGHLSSIGVKVGDTVEKGQVLGRSGMTGLAGGDHLHFTMLVGGQQVTPVEWWSPQWMQDRVLRKIARRRRRAIIEGSRESSMQLNRSVYSSCAALVRGRCSAPRAAAVQTTRQPATPAAAPVTNPGGSGHRRQRSPARSRLQGTPPPNPSINDGLRSELHDSRRARRRPTFVVSGRRRCRTSSST